VIAESYFAWVGFLGILRLLVFRKKEARRCCVLWKGHVGEQTPTPSTVGNP